LKSLRPDCLQNFEGHFLNDQGAAFLFLEEGRVMTETEIRIWRQPAESDERTHHKSADVVTNAPLALEQMGLETASDVLRRILVLPLCGRNPQTGVREE
jgi:hypothetical protein